MTPGPTFELSKWYMDCVSPEGDAVLAYCAEMRWRRLRICYESKLETTAGQPAVVTSSLKPHTPPHLDDGGVRWTSRALGVDAAWTAISRPIEHPIFRSAAGAIDWWCVLPSGTARVETHGRLVAGNGYVERVTMTVAPWRLPISSLRWGRIATDEDAIVWIEWGFGAASRTMAYANGAQADVVHVDDEHLALGDGTRITFDRGRVIRSGALGTTVLPSIPVLRGVAPLRLLGIAECKWLSRAVITRPGGATTGTWAIHELVTWPGKGLRASAFAPPTDVRRNGETSP